jgi:hypothetical protein
MRLLCNGFSCFSLSLSHPVQEKPQLRRWKVLIVHYLPSQATEPHDVLELGALFLIAELRCAAQEYLRLPDPLDL